MAPTPIQTRAYGCLFRSRLEARWAVFFTTLGIRWEYEPEGFDLDGERYLPDFRVWTPQGGPIWYEIKPANITQDPKYARFARELNTDPYWGRSALLSGDPRHVTATASICPRCGIIQPERLKHIERFGDLDVSLECLPCDMETPSGGGNPWHFNGFLSSVWTHNKGWIETPAICYSRLQQILSNAATAALSARFEHGESPE